jgi:hypothetical protein
MARISPRPGCPAARCRRLELRESAGTDLPDVADIAVASTVQPARRGQHWRRWSCNPPRRDAQRPHDASSTTSPGCSSSTSQHLAARRDYARARHGRLRVQAVRGAAKTEHHESSSSGRMRAAAPDGGPRNRPPGCPTQRRVQAAPAGAVYHGLATPSFRQQTACGRGGTSRRNRAWRRALLHCGETRISSRSSVTCAWWSADAPHPAGRDSPTCWPGFASRRWPGRPAAGRSGGAAGLRCCGGGHWWPAALRWLFLADFGACSYGIAMQLESSTAAAARRARPIADAASR